MQIKSGIWRSTVKSIKEVGFNPSKSNLSMSQTQNHSIVTDNSERLRENLEMIRKSKALKERATIATTK